jgi:hypothetical protein
MKPPKKSAFGNEDSGLDSSFCVSPSTSANSTPANPIGWPTFESPPKLFVETSKERLERLAAGGKGHRLVGRRVITLEAWEWSLQRAMEHGKCCKKDGVVQFVNENQQGLNSFMILECIGCGWNLNINTDLGETSTLHINEALVWGTYAGGSHYESSRHLLTALEIPVPDLRNFQFNENRLVDSWQDALVKDLEANGRQERSMALEAGNTVSIKGITVACTGVYVDGGWSTRSYGHSFKSKGGVAVIIGQYTKKILFLGIRNKFCYFCKRHEKDSRTPSHRCFQNFDTSKSATSMEPDILLEGFNKSISMHNLVYNKMIGDGDSSVYITLLHAVKYEGVKIEKVECVNHAVKRFNSHMIAISRNSHAYPLQQRKAVVKELNRFGKSLRAAIIYNHENNPTEPNKLRLHIQNIPFHIFGQHTNCSDAFCKTERKGEQNRVPTFQGTEIWKAMLEVIRRAANISER